jgi:hypothetical protein
MRRFRHLLAILDLYQATFPNQKAKTRAEELARRFAARRVRIGARLSRQVTSFSYLDNLNQFLRELSGQVGDHEMLNLIYETVNEIYQETRRRAHRKDGGQEADPGRLSRLFREKAPERYARIESALHEEGRVRGLRRDRALLVDHCPIWYSHFAHDSFQKMKKLLSLSEEKFHALVYSFAAELALTAERLAGRNYFDWKAFSYSGFSRQDFEQHLGDRSRQLALFGLTPGADMTAIRKRFKELAKQHHPDLGGDALLMRRINSAYRILIDEAGLDNREE